MSDKELHGMQKENSKRVNLIRIEVYEVTAGQDWWYNVGVGNGYCGFANSDEISADSYGINGKGEKEK